MRLCTLAAVCLFALPAIAQAQDHSQHMPGMQHPAPAAALPTQGGQAAFAAIQEIARLLEADPSTDWSKVNLEKLRLHLVDMDLVTLQSKVTSADVADGATFTVRGTPAVAAAIKRMTAAHLQMVEMEGGPKVTRTELPDGVKLMVTARTPGDAAAAAKIRGLGFIGLMVSGDHHQMHHLMMARGDAMMSHGR
ncbi:MAG: hypothetical protein K2R93_15025 [Gemmatimonadaceae bacterium]|nr:hypothetical protein [Gemmatimonadaceae bacterium]